MTPKAFGWFYLHVASGLKVLDVGASRTGTQSMTTAMEILGYKGLHSGYDEAGGLREPSCNYLFNNGSLEEAFATFDGYDFAADTPYFLLYEEVMNRFPDSKFILTPKDPEDWFNSHVKLLFSCMPTCAEDYRKKEEDLGVCFRALFWGCDFLNPTDLEAKAICQENFQRHNEHVQRVIPPERLLIYNFSDGWASLSHFLNAPIPEVEFPHTDTELANGYALRIA
ncbi:unnamed protein product [Effrenium voratum]|nr:unnamed protein product [Effrenium voratum]